MRDGNKLDLLKDYVQSILEFVVKVADDGCSESMRVDTRGV